MTDILKALYNGQISPIEEDIPDPQYQKLNQEIMKIERVLIDNLPAEHRKTLDLLYDIYSQNYSLESFYSFKSGFKLGTKIMLEVLTNN